MGNMCLTLRWLWPRSHESLADVYGRKLLIPKNGLETDFGYNSQLLLADIYARFWENPYYTIHTKKKAALELRLVSINSH